MGRILAVVLTSALTVLAAASAFSAAGVLPESGTGSVQLAGDANALRLEAHDASVADVLAAMVPAFGLQYRSAIALDQRINGIYAGSLGRVIARVLAGYDYTIEHQDHAVAISVLGKHGEQAVPVPAAIAPVRPAHCGQSAGHRAACQPL
jgi:hypothetical protein